MTNLEDQIIAYLDGTLDENSRAELLHMLSVSPEKRKLLEEHIKLREIISLGHKPQPVPLRTEKQLADRIPVLLQELPYLAEKSTRFVPVAGIRSTSYLSAVSRYVSGFFTSRFGPAIGLGTLALVGGLAWYALSSSQDSNTRDSDIANIAASRQSNTGVNGNSVESGTQGTANITAPWSTQSSIEKSSATSSTNNSPIGIQLNRHSHTNLAHRERMEGSQNISAENSNSNIQTESNFTEVPNRQSESQELANNNDRRNAQDDAESSVKSNLATSSTDVPQSNASDIKNPAIDPTPLPLPSENESITGRWYIQGAMASDMNFRPNVQEQAYQAGAGKTSPVLGGGYEFSPNFAVGLELGLSELSQQNQETILPSSTGSAPDNKLSEVQRMEYITSIVDVDAVWTQATLRYTLNPEDRYRIEATGGAGAAYVDGFAPMVSFGIGGIYSLTKNLDITMGATVRGAWLGDQGSATTVTEPLNTIEAPVGVVTNRAASATIFTSAVSGRIGVRFGF